MDRLALLTYAEDQLDRVVRGLDAAEMDVVTNCPPWTVRRLASHALKNQLFWAGTVTGRQLMMLEESMGAVPYDGDLAPYAAEITAQAVELWNRDGVLTAQHDTPFGTLPGTVVIDFAIIDAAAHAWDLSASLGRAIEFPDGTITALSDVVALTCTDHTVELGLIKPPTEVPSDATPTERLMAAAGRTIARGRRSSTTVKRRSVSPAGQTNEGPSGTNRSTASRTSWDSWRSAAAELARTLSGLLDPTTAEATPG